MDRIGKAVEFSWKDVWCCGVVGMPRTSIWGNSPFSIGCSTTSSVWISGVACPKVVSNSPAYH